MSAEKKPESVLEPFKEALQFWNVQLAKPDELTTSVPAAKLEDPLTELTKLAKLIKAQTTKVGIVYAPDAIKKPGDAAHDTVAELSKTFVFYISALAQLSPKKISSLFLNEIVEMSKALVGSAVEFVTELQDILNKKDSEDDKSSQRLVSVGKLWLHCDEIGQFIERGNLKFLQLKTALNLSLIEDGLEEFEEWVQNPQDFDDDDFFGLEDELSDGEAPAEEKEDLEDEASDNADIIKFGEALLKQIKLVKLLFLSINKSLPSVTAGSDIDDIYATEKTVARHVDLLIVELMMSKEIDEEVKRLDSAIEKACFKIISILRGVNKASEAKVKWCTSWEAKYKELQDAK